MTFETGTAVDFEDLLSKLDTFATSTHGGWTAGYSPNPNTTNGWFELHKTDLSFGMKFPVGAQAPVANASVHHARTYINSSTAPGKHTNDSGNGYNATDTGHTNALLDDERCLLAIGDGLFPSYHFFADSTGAVDYIYVVVQTATVGMYRHFGFGTFNKFGDDWDGGQFVYGHFQEVSSLATATDPDTQVLLDALASNATQERRAATVRIGGALLNRGAANYGVCFSGSALTDNDNDGNPRRKIHGGFRGGLEARPFATFVGNQSEGFISLTPINVYYRDPNNARVQRLGYLDDVAQVNIRNFSPGQEVVYDGDTWVLFPTSIRTTDQVAYRSLYSGIAYKKVV